MVRLRKIPLIAISMGDPAGIGPEVILKAAARLARRRGTPMLAVIGDIGAMRETACRLGAEVPEPYEWSVGDKPLKHGNGLAVISAGKLSRDARRPAHPTAEGADAAYRYVVEGAQMALAGEVDALVTAPINKEWLNRAGHRFPGHSELLAELAHTPLWRMMFAGERLRLALVTVHMGLAKVRGCLRATASSIRSGCSRSICAANSGLRGRESSCWDSILTPARTGCSVTRSAR